MRDRRDRSARRPRVSSRSLLRSEAAPGVMGTCAEIVPICHRGTRPGPVLRRDAPLECRPSVGCRSVRFRRVSLRLKTVNSTRRPSADRSATADNPSQVRSRSVAESGPSALISIAVILLRDQHTAIAANVLKSDLTEQACHHALFSVQCHGAKGFDFSASGCREPDLPTVRLPRDAASDPPNHSTALASHRFG